MPAVHIRAAARRDLIDQYVYLAEHADEVTAERFLVQAERSFELLATQPYMGATLTLKCSELAGLRKWNIEGFENTLVFYLPRGEGVSIVRVLHAARDWWSLLGIDVQ